MTHADTARRHRPRWPLTAALLVLLLLAFALVVQSQGPDALLQEPVWFTHEKHLAAGIPCLFCHPGPLSTAVAGLPSVAKCVGCHQNIDVQTDRGKATIEQVMAHAAAGKGIVWNNVYLLPDFVRFTHQPHIAAGFNCERCHGNVAKMEYAYAAYRLNMGFCLSCHRSQQGPKKVFLETCWTCHQ